MENNQILEIEDKNGKKYSINVFATFKDGGNDYVIASDYADNTKNYIFKLENADETATLVSIDNEKEFERLSLIANKIILEEIK